MTSPLDRARDVTTPAADLHALASSSDASVRLAVAANPSTPRDTVEALLRASSVEETVALINALLGNASLPLWLLDDPAWLHRLDRWKAMEMARSPSLPRVAWDGLCAHPDRSVRMAAMVSPDAPPDAWRLCGFATEPDALLAAISASTTMHAKVGEPLLRRLIQRFVAHPEVPTRLRDDPDWLRRKTTTATYALTRSPSLTPLLWDALRLPASWGLQLHLLRSPGAPPDAWTRLALPTEGSWDMSRSGIDSADLEFLARYPIVTAITQLSLSHNTLADTSLQALIRSSVFPRLESLDLSDTRMGVETVHELARTTAFPALTGLNLSRARMHDEGLLALARSSTLPHLTHLRLAGCKLSDHGISELARTTAFQLTHLELPSNSSHDEDDMIQHVTDTTAIALARSPAMACLTHLDLSWNAITDKGALALTRAPFFPNLTELHLIDCSLSKAGKDALRKAAASFPQLRIVLDSDP